MKKNLFAVLFLAVGLISTVLAGNQRLPIGDDSLIKSNALKYVDELQTFVYLLPAEGEYWIGDGYWGLDVTKVKGLTEGEILAKASESLRTFVDGIPESGTYRVSYTLYNKAKSTAPALQGEEFSVPIMGGGFEIEVGDDLVIPSEVYQLDNFTDEGWALFVPIPVPSWVKWVEIGVDWNSSRDVRAVNGSDCYPHLAGNGFIYVPIRLARGDATEMTWRNAEDGDVWRRFSINSGLAIAESDPAPPWDDIGTVTLSLAPKLVKGGLEITIPEELGNEVIVQTSDDMVAWEDYPPGGIIVVPASQRAKNSVILPLGGSNKFIRVVKPLPAAARKN